MKVKMELILSTILALYAVAVFPPGYLILTAIVSIMAYTYTESYFGVLGVLIIMTILRLLKSVLVPTIESQYGAVSGPTGGKVVGVEGFQPKDPVSIHKRVAETKKTQSKTDNVQGVLEAPSILNSLQISNVDPAERGVSRQTLPAILGTSEPIRTPAEGFMPNVPSPDSMPRGNPYLQGGADNEAVGTALNYKAAMGDNENNNNNNNGNNVDPAAINGASVGPSPY
jgi:hypothetical protein